ncbi:50S ribosomal protein L13 [Candidatus Curtissbacteria bacterium RBG_13_35_7]|uniref:Large ribosomal subunit protein uL13 n=1 Tax=Candidatus Curtissbacteria bacterium RBG_13_35_7 TaxID=1797705 RepID=A0A1F5G0S0_9BACT|nr:MAG: 50S ribosomal protein L13 [Candidatus Curtissbacteria bacterium RBG_13_35_7]
MKEMKSIKLKSIQRKWYLIDANKQILGRLSTEVAMHLMGKNKSSYVPYLDCGDYVVIINAKNVKLSGKKEIQKKYYHHSGYPGGLYTKTASEIRAKKPEFLIRHAVRGMLPKTTLGKQMLKKLYIYSDNKHPYSEKITTTDNTPKSVNNSSHDKIMSTVVAKK